MKSTMSNATSTSAEPIMMDIFPFGNPDGHVGLHVTARKHELDRDFSRQLITIRVWLNHRRGRIHP
jgi:hypothetical protein